MSQGVNYLHSHSILERTLHFPKSVVAVDAIYGDLFSGVPTEKFSYHGKQFIKVPTISFVSAHGEFKGLDD